jgi:hypothetical protein
MADKIVRIDTSVIDDLRKRYPSLADEADAVVIRVGFKNLVAEADKKKEEKQ